MRIENVGEPAAFKSQIAEMDEAQLVAQSLVQQGAVHAVGFLLKYGCTEQLATDMLASLRENARLLRAEAVRRGKPDLFDSDQTGFN
ncbi:hypothetical protein ABXN37_28715 [Piscinibacter sakaiensis]|uniref:Uncharacterized protein n=1 Tax=Piscinibacter sakaiensis TaxID=1547922 RepID=A0A0K8P8S1_PISS1|nr:hypothetical protein [Piscinibacter sakaiensis]GAP39031.1 hypothetical protein ISF6_0558 [Piscinibacter sakaiensis]